MRDLNYNGGIPFSQILASSLQQNFIYYIPLQFNYKLYQPVKNKTNK
jgi:hypothetical protein